MTVFQQHCILTAIQSCSYPMGSEALQEFELTEDIQLKRPIPIFVIYFSIILVMITNNEHRILKVKTKMNSNTMASNYR